MATTLVMTGSTLAHVAAEVARALSVAREDERGAYITTPLLYPGGAHALTRIVETENGYLVSDDGLGRFEADLLGGDRLFVRAAREMAERYGVRFDSDMIFDAEVPRDALVTAVIAVSNASKHAVEQTAYRLSDRRLNVEQNRLWARLDRLFGQKIVAREVTVRGASEAWTFDALVTGPHHMAAFDIVKPHGNSVTSAVAKFLDLKELGEKNYARVAVLTDKPETPHLLLLGRTAKIINASDDDSLYEMAA